MFAKQLADRSTAGRRTLAELLMETASKSADNPVDRYVLLGGAIDAGKEASNLSLCVKAADDLATSFAVDGLAVKADAANATKYTGGTPSENEENVQIAFLLVERLMTIENYAGASRLCATLSRASSGMTVLHPEIESKLKEINALKTLREKAEAAAAKLKSNPSDPESNFAAGNYLCFGAGDWKRGLPLLEKSSDAPLQPVLKLESAALLAAPDGPAQLALAEAWWNLPASANIPKAGSQSRAVYWYEGAEPTLTGLNKSAVESRVQEFKLAAATSNGVINLLGLVNVKRDVISGQRKCVDHELASDASEFSGLRIELQPPAEYDFRVAFTRVEGNNAVAQIIARPGHECAWLMGWDWNRVCGLDMINDQGADGGLNPTHTQRTAVLTNGRLHISVVRVRKDSITTVLDGIVMNKFKTDWSNVGKIRDGWALGDKAAIGLGSANSRVIFHAADLLPVNGTSHHQ